MSKTPSNPESKISVEPTNNSRKESTKIYCQWRNSDGILFFKDKAPNYQPVHRKDTGVDKKINLSKLNAQKITIHDSQGKEMINPISEKSKGKSLENKTKTDTGRIEPFNDSSFEEAFPKTEHGENKGTKI